MSESINPEDYIKVILLGESGVGKTNLINVSQGKEFDYNSMTSLSSSYSNGTLVYKDKEYFYVLWDTAGQESYRSLNKIFMKNSNVVLVLYENTESDYEVHFLNVLGNVTAKYKNLPEKKLKFTILNYRLNEPRDILVQDGIFPLAYLYTNAMKETKLLKFTPKNDTETSIEEFENFLKEKLEWDSDETKKEGKEKVEVKHDKDKKEEKEHKNEDL